MTDDCEINWPGNHVQFADGPGPPLPRTDW